jgi:hypothetical protein
MGFWNLNQRSNAMSLFQLFTKRARRKSAKPRPVALQLESLEDRLVPAGTATAWVDHGDLAVSVGVRGGVEITAGKTPGEVIVRGLNWSGLVASAGGSSETAVSSPDADADGQTVTLDGVTGDFNFEIDQQAEVVLTNIQIPGHLHIAGDWYGSTPQREYVVRLDGVGVHNELEIAADTRTWDAQLGLVDDGHPSDSSYAEVHVLNSDIGDDFKVKFSCADVEVNNSHIGHDMNVNTDSSGNSVRVLQSHISSGMGLDLRNGGFMVNNVQITGSTFDNHVEVHLNHESDAIHVQGSMFNDSLDCNGSGTTRFYNDGGNHFNSLNLNDGIVEVNPPIMTATQAIPLGPQAPPPGPRVIECTPFPDHLRVTFDKTVAVSSFTPDQVAITDQLGHQTPVQNIRVVPNSDDCSFDVFFQPFASGGYRAVIGPNITDTSGNAMDQDGNGVNGENPGDLYTISGFTKPQVQQAVPSYGHIRVTFNERIDPATFTAGSVTLTGVKGKPVSFLGVSPVMWSEGCQYDIQVSAFPRGGYWLTIAPTAEDAFGNRMAGVYTTKYYDNTPPQVVGLSNFRPWFGVTITFSKPIDVSRFTPAAATVSLRTGQRIPVREVREVEYSDSRSFDIRFQANPGDYHLTLDTKVFDLFGNQLASPYQADFSLRLTPPAGPGLPGKDLLPYLGGVLPYHIDPTDPAWQAMLQTLTQRMENWTPDMTPSQRADAVAGLFSAGAHSPIGLASTVASTSYNGNLLQTSGRPDHGGLLGSPFQKPA